MLRVVSKHLKEVSTLRRLLFAVANLPDDLPNVWKVAFEFAIKDTTREDDITAERSQLLMENLQEFDAAAFATDRKLLQDLMEFQIPKYKPIGVVLISKNDKCLVCKSTLLLRKDRSASVVIYDNIMGSIPGTHYHKYCSNSSCGFTQYYGYYTTKGSSKVLYNCDWQSLSYFVSSRESCFSMELMKHFNAEILIGQLSFKQCADLYNYVHNYTCESSTNR